MDLQTQRLMQAAAGAGGDPVYVEDVFTTHVYKGDGANSRTITTGIDMGTEGGMTWLRDRGGNVSNMLFDTERGARKPINSENNNAEQSYPSGKSLTGWTTTGFTLGQNHNTENWSGYDYVNWNFRKAKGFFDVVTFTQASGTPTNQRISHSLGSAPGMIWMKCTSASRDWFCYHRSLGKDKYFKLNGTGAAANATNGWGTSEPDATEFGFNAYEFGLSTGSTYVAYVFAHDDQSFGEGGDQSIIKCGTFNKTGDTDVDVGWEPQFVFLTMYEGPSSRGLVDQRRGFYFEDNSRFLKAQNSNAENNTTTKLNSSKGFRQGGDTGNWIYMAIRFPDGYVSKPAEVGTDVFTMDWGNGSANGPAFDSNFSVDFTFSKQTASVGYWITTLRPLKKWLKLNTTGNAGALTSYERYDFFKGVHQQYNSSNLAYMWKRHAGFDVVTYDGRQGGATVMNLKHNLGVVPEMIWIKKTNNNGMWAIYHKGVNGGTNPEQYMMQIDTNGQEDQPTFMNDTAPTATHFTVGSMSSVNDSGDHYISLLFASVEGISKVGYYTGDGTSGRSITTGFQPRFILVKRTDGGSNWLLCDSFRGVDKNLFINATDASSGGQRVSTSSTAFSITAHGAGYINVNNEKYIYYCHA